MKRLLSCLLVMGVVGRGDASPSPSQAQPDNSAVPSATRDAQAKLENGSPAAPRTAADGPDVQVADTDPVAALEKLGAVIKRDDSQIISVEGGDDGRLAELVVSLQGEVIKVTFNGSQITDAGLAHLAGLTKLQSISLPKQITDARIAELHDREVTPPRSLAGGGSAMIVRQSDPWVGQAAAGSLSPECRFRCRAERQLRMPTQTLFCDARAGRETGTAPAHAELPLLNGPVSKLCH